MNGDTKLPTLHRDFEFKTAQSQNHEPNNLQALNIKPHHQTPKQTKGRRLKLNIHENTNGQSLKRI